MSLPNEIQAREMAVLQCGLASVWTFEAPTGPWKMQKKLEPSDGFELKLLQDQKTDNVRCLVYVASNKKQFKSAISNHFVHPLTVLHSIKDDTVAMWVQDYISQEESPREVCIQIKFTDRGLIQAFLATYKKLQTVMGELHEVTRDVWSSKAERTAPALARAAEGSLNGGTIKAAANVEPKSTFTAPSTPAKNQPPADFNGKGVNKEQDKEDEDDREEGEVENEETEDEEGSDLDEEDEVDDDEEDDDEEDEDENLDEEDEVDDDEEEEDEVEDEEENQVKTIPVETSSARPFSLSELAAKQKQGNWKCDVCLTSNPESAEACLACESPRPGAKQSVPIAATSTPIGFSFSGPTTSTTASNATSGFSFSGANSSSTSNQGFSFSAPSGGVSMFGNAPLSSASSSKPNASSEGSGLSFGGSTASAGLFGSNTGGGFSFSGFGSSLGLNGTPSKSIADTTAGAEKNKDKTGNEPTSSIKSGLALKSEHDTKPSDVTSVFSGLGLNVDDRKGKDEKETFPNEKSGSNSGSLFGSTQKGSSGSILFGGAPSSKPLFPTTATPSEKVFSFEASPTMKPKPFSPPNRDSGMSSLRIDGSASPKARLTKFYEKHNPTKLSEVPKLLEKYKGQEETLFEKLKQKYNLKNLDDEPATPNKFNLNEDSSAATSPAPTPSTAPSSSTKPVFAASALGGISTPSTISTPQTQTPGGFFGAGTIQFGQPSMLASGSLGSRLNPATSSQPASFGNFGSSSFGSSGAASSGGGFSGFATLSGGSSGFKDLASSDTKNVFGADPGTKSFSFS